MKVFELLEAYNPVKAAERMLQKRRSQISDAQLWRLADRVWSLLDDAKSKGLHRHPDHRESYLASLSKVNDIRDAGTLKELKRHEEIVGEIIETILQYDKKLYPKTLAFANKILENKDMVVKYFLTQLKILHQQEKENFAYFKRGLLHKIDILHRLGYHYKEIDTIERTLRNGVLKDRTQKPKQLKFKFEAAILDLMEQYDV